MRGEGGRRVFSRRRHVESEEWQESAVAGRARRRLGLADGGRGVPDAGTQRRHLHVHGPPDPGLDRRLRALHGRRRLDLVHLRRLHALRRWPVLFDLAPLTVTRIEGFLRFRSSVELPAIFGSFLLTDIIGFHY